MSLVPIFGKFYSNKNLAIVLSEFLQPEIIIKMVRLNKKCQQAYSQDIIWWKHLHKSFPELR